MGLNHADFQITIVTLNILLGNLTRANIKFPNGQIDVLQGKFDILSISGVMSCNFGTDLKIMLADETVCCQLQFHFVVNFHLRDARLAEPYSEIILYSHQ